MHPAATGSAILCGLLPKSHLTDGKHSESPAPPQNSPRDSGLEDPGDCTGIGHSTGYSPGDSGLEDPGDCTGIGLDTVLGTHQETVAWRTLEIARV